MTRLEVKVVPASSRDCLAGWLGSALKVRVKAAPERGKANAAVEKLLAKALDIPPGDLHIVSGTSSSHKIVEVAGLSAAELRDRLDSLAG